MWYSCITTLAIWVYIKNDVVFADISNRNTSVSTIIDLIRPVDEWADITLSARQNAENAHGETLNKLVHKLNFHHLTCLYKALNVVLLCQYSKNARLHLERSGIYYISYPNTIISKIIDLIKPVDEWSEIALSARLNAEKEHCETLKKLVHKLNFHH